MKRKTTKETIEDRKRFMQDVVASRQALGHLMAWPLDKLEELMFFQSDTDDEEAQITITRIHPDDVTMFFLATAPTGARNPKKNIACMLHEKTRMVQALGAIDYANGRPQIRSFGLGRARLADTIQDSNREGNRLLRAELERLQKAGHEFRLVGYVPQVNDLPAAVLGRFGLPAEDHALIGTDPSNKA